MTDSFSRPGAVDLSALAGAKGRHPGSQAGAPAAPPGQQPAGSEAGSGAYTVDITAENFQAEMQRSTTVPVVLCFYSTQSPDSVRLTDTLGRLADEFEGRFLLANVDVDANPQVAQAVGAPGVPLVAVALGGQLAPVAQQDVPEDELRKVLQQVVQTAVANGMTGRVEPRAGTAPRPDAEEAEEKADPKYAEAEEALASGDIDAAVAAYQRLVDADPSDAEARRGLGAAALMRRTQGVDLTAARTAAADNPDDVAAQIRVADLDVVGGHVEDAFDRLVQTVMRTGGEERDQVKKHLLGLFDLVGNDDPRVLTFRTRLASALF